LSEVTRVKYRGIAIADTARTRPVLTVQLLDKQQRLTVSSIEDKRKALLAGLGVATMPYALVAEDIAAGRLRVVSPEYSMENDIIMAWRRDSMGEAKSWFLREIPRLFASNA
jgi:DNA-binding transcriptional LysR family regulator